jgi:hypothetical protein
LQKKKDTAMIKAEHIKAKNKLEIEKLYLESKEERNNILENDSVLDGEFGLDNEMNKSKKKK